ncbi:MAG: leucine-rich repeat domain-containing protein, partial [Clostridia bacterium]|nr:leucine-rich repeat domain-containing protein [Clostridia bacterium]
AVALPAGVTEIGEYAFFECRGLEAVNIPAGVTEIQGYTFANCKSLAEITIHEGITAIGLYAFYGCSEVNISFVLSTGWSCAHWSTPTDYTALSPDDLADSSIATAYLSTTYYQYSWKRED